MQGPGGGPPQGGFPRPPQAQMQGAGMQPFYPNQGGYPRPPAPPEVPQQTPEDIIEEKVGLISLDDHQLCLVHRCCLQGAVSAVLLLG